VPSAREGSHEIAHRPVLGPRVRQPPISKDLIVVPPPDPDAFQEPLLDQVRNDGLRGSRADSHFESKVAEAEIGPPGERDEYHPVVREERPAMDRHSRNIGSLLPLWMRRSPYLSYGSAGALRETRQHDLDESERRSD
jgi:hypothetical protein